VEQDKCICCLHSQFVIFELTMLSKTLLLIVALCCTSTLAQNFRGDNNPNVPNQEQAIEALEALALLDIASMSESDIQQVQEEFNSMN
jgi:hypothetical protein